MNLKYITLSTSYNIRKKGVSVLDFSISGFEDYLANCHYAAGTSSVYRHYVIKFLKWKNRDRIRSQCSLQKAILDYRPSNHTERAALHGYYRYMTGEKLSSSLHNDSVSWINEELDGFLSYLSDIASLELSTVSARCKYVRRFLQYISAQGVLRASGIKADYLKSFLSVELARCKPSSRKTIATHLRSYFRYLQFRGEIIDKAILNVPISSPVWSRASLPKNLSAQETDAFLSSFDLSNSEGIRDYAIAVLMLELGLRCSEVASLTLDDFNWHQSSVLIRKTKSSTERLLPIPDKVGHAIYAYLTCLRQPADIRNLFLSIKRRNGTAMTNTQIRKMILRAYKRAGIESAKGTHVLRHTMARTMYENGVCLKQIADILGHTSINTSQIYTKVNMVELRTVACEWAEVDN